MAQSWRMDQKRAKPPKSPAKSYDTAALERLAMHYVARYATSQTRLRGYLLRKLGRSDDDGAEPPDIERIITKMVDLGFVDDSGYARMRAATMLRRGYGARRIGDALRHDGIAEEGASSAISNSGISPLEAADIYARRRRIGPYSPHSSTPDARQRAIAALLRAGHSYSDISVIFARWT